MSLILSAWELSSWHQGDLFFLLSVCAACVHFVRVPVCSYKKHRSQNKDLFYCVLRSRSLYKNRVMFSFYHDRKAIVLKAQNQMSEAHKLLQKLLIHCQKIKNTEMVIR